MDNTRHLLHLLLDGDIHSGEDLGNRLHMSRAAVWKHIQKLSAYGLPIKTIRGQGYQLPYHSQLLQAEEIQQHLSSNTAQAIRQLDIFFALNSTHQYLLQQSLNHNTHAWVVLAEHQTDGIGRRGRQWVSVPAAGVYLSMAWHYDEVPELLHCLSLSVGLALTRVLKQYQIQDLSLKWPNDVYVNDRKLAGILIDSQSENAGQCRVTLGLGLNVFLSEQQKQHIPQAVVALSEVTNAEIDRNQLVADIISECVLLLQTFNRTRAEDDLQQWQSMDYLLGKQVEVSSAGITHSGEARGIDNNGCLLVDVQNQLQAFYSAEVKLQVSS